jgi:glucokinase
MGKSTKVYDLGSVANRRFRPHISAECNRGAAMSKGDCALLADIGGTNARLALMNDREIGAIDHLKVSEFPNVTEAISAFLQRRVPHRRVHAAVLGVAGPVYNNRCTITNSGWLIDGTDLQQTFGFDAVRVLNDFEAVAWSLPKLRPQDVYALGDQRGVAGAPMLALGPGTGFGAACLFCPQATTPFAAVTEAGHATVPATSHREELVIAHLRRRYSHVSIERILSGTGLENLYQALAGIDGVTVPERDAAAITTAGLSGSCGISEAALEMFCSWLGAVAGNLALTFSARGGVYIAGGIVPRLGDRLSLSSFRKKFESKGRFESYLREIPTKVVVRADDSFIGLRAFFDRNMVSGPKGR